MRFAETRRKDLPKSLKRNLSICERVVEESGSSVFHERSKWLVRDRRFVRAVFLFRDKKVDNSLRSRKTAISRYINRKGVRQLSIIGPSLRFFLSFLASDFSRISACWTQISNFKYLNLALRILDVNRATYFVSVISSSIQKYYDYLS